MRRPRLAGHERLDGRRDCGFDDEVGEEVGGAFSRYDGGHDERVSLVAFDSASDLPGCLGGNERSEVFTAGTDEAEAEDAGRLAAAEQQAAGTR
jgi:hypothetical protein